jgi:hypothetical protein
VEGLANYELYSLDGTRRLLVRERFSACVEGTKWLVRTELVSADPPLAAAQLPFPPSQQIGSDGVDTYCLKAMPPGANNLGQYAMAEPGSIPNLFDSPTVCLVWLAFCAGSHLPAEGKAELTPIWGSARGPRGREDCKMAVTFERNRSRPEYLDVLRYISDGRLDPCNPSWTKTNLMAPPWGSGWTQAVFRVESAFRAEGGTNVPGALVFESFTPRPGSNSVLKLAARIRGSVTKAVVGVARDSWLPELPGERLTARDYRFTRSVTNWSYVAYPVSNRWEARTSPLVAAAVRTHEESRPLPLPVWRNPRAIRIALAFIMVVSFGVAAIGWFKTRNAAKGNE